MAAPNRCPRRSTRRSTSRLTAAGATLAVLVVVAVTAIGCSSDGEGPALPDRSTTSSASSGGSTTTTRPDRTTTTTEPRTTTTTGDGPTTTTTRPATTTTTSEPTTTTTRPATTTTTERSTTTTTERTTTTSTAAPTTTISGVATGPIGEGESDVPWLAIAALGVLAVGVLAIALHRRSVHKDWWGRADALVRDGRALADLGAAGPAGTDPQQQVAHWGTLEQRTQALATEVQAVLDARPPDDPSRAAVAGLGQAVADYLGALRTSRTLRIGPPAPTAEQLQFADAESNQRLAVVRANLDQLDQLVVPHRRAAASTT